MVNRRPQLKTAFRYKVPYPQSGAAGHPQSMNVSMQHVLREGYHKSKKRFIKVALKGVIKGCLIK